MSKIWMRAFCMAVVAVVSLVVVDDAEARHRRRRRGCDGYAGGYYGGKGGYAWGGYGYSGGYAGYQYAPAYYSGGFGPVYGGFAPSYGGTTIYSGGYGGTPVYESAPTIQTEAAILPEPIGASGTIDAGLAPADRSARLESPRLIPNQRPAGGTTGEANLGTPNARSNDTGIQGVPDAASTRGDENNLRAAPPVAPGTR
jgi:hypothetical protein